MWKIGALVGLLLISSCTANFCYSDVESACNTRESMGENPTLANCNAQYGAINHLLTDLQAYVSAHIDTSFEYLLMSSHFGNYDSNRDGFKGFFRKMSDKAWENAIDLIKFITKRGGKMNFNVLPRIKRSDKNLVLELPEINSLARALDTEKQMANEALHIHNIAEHHANKHDASVSHYIEEKFIEPQAETIRTLAGHTNDLKRLLSDNDAAVSLFMFDEYLKSTL
ncbi:ferritin, lower subunit [Chelonus insularis]|uniref:ferritin, lower subunit n=1 Tax=Chelonus insularis TaxID=460826 RepID=UPI00158EB4D3|nr:ferritin, lower subunit [Chelonus insularis]XP_034950717.1 ferritin, lower subunit [Chelonus insularis]